MKKTLSNNTRYRFKGTIVDKSIRVTHGRYEEIFILDDVVILDTNTKLKQQLQLIESQATRKLEPNINDVVEFNAKLIKLDNKYKVTYLTNVLNHSRPCNEKVEMRYQVNKEKKVKDTTATQKQIELMEEMCEYLGLENPNITDSSLITKWFKTIRNKHPKISYELKKYRNERNKQLCQQKLTI